MPTPHLQATTLDIEVIAGKLPPLRTFVIRLVSTLTGYEVRVAEKQLGGACVPMALDMPPRQSVHASQFYPQRAPYGALLIKDVMAELNAWRLGPARDGATVLPATMGVVVTDAAVAQAVADDFTGWDPLDVADKASAVPGTAILLARSAGGAPA